jgi:hypothetical protein
MQILTENCEGFKAMIKENPAVTTDITALLKYTCDDAIHGDKPMMMVRDAANQILVAPHPDASPRAAVMSGAKSMGRRMSTIATGGGGDAAAAAAAAAGASANHCGSWVWRNILAKEMACDMLSRWILLCTQRACCVQARLVTYQRMVLRKV